MTTTEFGIGVSDLAGGGGNRYGKGKFFWLETNKPNIYRVLPPVLSCAATGEYFKFHAVHRNMRTADRKQRPFLCIEDVDYKTKIIKHHCPVCDRRRELEAQYENMKKSGQLTKEQLQEFWALHLDALQVERRFFMNVVNQAGEIGILPIPTKLKNDMRTTFERMNKEEGVDPTGRVGVFFNFVKNSPFKGSKDVTYKVEAFLETTMENGRPVKSYKYHELTPDFIDRMKVDCKDLNTLQRQLTVEEMAALANSDANQRAQLLEGLFKAGERTQDGETDDDADPLAQPIPGVAGAVAVGQYSITPNGATYKSNNLAGPAAPAPVQPAGATVVPPVAVATAPAPAAKATHTPPPTGKVMSDDEFMKHFMGQTKKGDA